MNKHFEDARYYLKRAAETARKGMAEELEPVAERFEELVGGDEEPEPGRVDQLRADLAELQDRAEGEAREAIGEARKRLKSYRERRDVPAK